MAVTKMLMLKLQNSDSKKVGKGAIMVVVSISYLPFED